jgi:hypothetical protein
MRNFRTTSTFRGDAHGHRGTAPFLLSGRTAASMPVGAHANPGALLRRRAARSPFCQVLERPVWDRAAMLPGHAASGLLNGQVGLSVTLAAIGTVRLWLTWRVAYWPHWTLLADAALEGVVFW